MVVFTVAVTVSCCNCYSKSWCHGAKTHIRASDAESIAASLFPSHAFRQASYDDGIQFDVSRRRRLAYGGIDNSANPFRRPNSIRAGMHFLTPRVNLRIATRSSRDDNGIVPKIRSGRSSLTAVDEIHALAGKSVGDFLIASVRHGSSEVGPFSFVPISPNHGKDAFPLSAVTAGTDTETAYGIDDTDHLHSLASDPDLDTRQGLFDALASAAPEEISTAGPGTGPQ
jgi:hypothetical protein